MLDISDQNSDNRVVDTTPSFLPNPPSAGFLLGQIKMISLDMVQDELMEIEYDLTLEQSVRDELAEKEPHFSGLVQLVDGDGRGVPGCYMTTPYYADASLEDFTGRY